MSLSLFGARGQSADATPNRRALPLSQIMWTSGASVTCRNCPRLWLPSELIRITDPMISDWRPRDTCIGPEDVTAQLHGFLARCGVQRPVTNRSPSPSFLRNEHLDLASIG
jgi:hypothetical protein